MGVATAGVGLIPSTAAIGIAAPIIVIFLRILQGLALGGEYGGAAIYVAEHSPPGKRGFYTSFIQASVVGGFVLSLAVVLACRLSLIAAEDLAAWGWRVPFLLSIAAARHLAVDAAQALGKPGVQGDEGGGRRPRATRSSRASPIRATRSGSSSPCSASPRA